MDIVRLADSMANQRHVAAIRRGFLICIPLVIIGSFAIMLSHIPSLSDPQSMISWFGPQWTVLWQAITNASLNGISISLVLSTSYFLADKYYQDRTSQVHPLMVSLVAFTCFMALIQPFAKEGFSGLPFAWTGVDGIFLALLDALVSTEIFLRLCSIKRSAIRLFADVADPILSQALACILPAAGTVAVFVLVKVGAAQAGVYDIQAYLYVLVDGWFQTIDSLPGEMSLVILLVHLFWFFGLHGNHIMYPVLQSIPLADLQLAGYLAGTGDSTAFALKTFLNLFVLIGGAGSTICLMLALFLVSRRGNMAWLIKLSILPAIFNINELLIFGLPIVLNPIFLIPFVLVPLVLAGVSYAAVNMGLVSVVVHNVHWTTPPLLNGYFATNSWSGVGLQLVDIVIGTMIYLPFVIINERQKTREIDQAFGVLAEEAKAANPQQRKRLLKRQDEVGTLARMLAHDLKLALLKGEFFLEFQPQVNGHNRVIGVEALLRWSHKTHGRVPPPLIIAVAEEAGMIDDVGKWVVRAACEQLARWKRIGIKDIRVAVNVSAVQLQREAFAGEVLEIISDNGLQPADIEIEITENVVLNDDVRTSYNLGKLREAGLRIAIDDFGMGHTSLRYIKYFSVDTLKIDGMLCRDVTRDRNCQEIISSIASLCASLNIDTIVEYVETEEQRDLLMQLGCTKYQGYYYSRPVSAPQVVDFVFRHNKADYGEGAAGDE